LIIVALIGLALWIGFNPLLKRVVVHHAQSLTGAKVEVAKLRFDTSTGQLFCNRLEAADPRAPMSNLIQSEIASLMIDTRSIKDRRLVINNGRLSQVMFGVPRTDNGTLHSELVVQKNSKPKLPRPEIDKSALSQSWLDSMTNELSGDSTGQPLASVTFAKDIQSKWTPLVSAHEQRLQSIAVDMKQIESAITKQISEAPNPLRNFNQHSEITKRTNGLLAEISKAQTELGELEQQAQTDRYALAQARIRDEQANLDEIKPVGFDEQSLSRLLLAELQQELVNQTVDWFESFRQTLPDPDDGFGSPAQRGIDINFLGAKQQPKFVINSLELDGQGKFANRHFNFAGTVTNFSNAPELSDSPIEFSIRAQSQQNQQNFVLNCTIDRRPNQNFDQIAVTCDDIPQTERLLGSSESFAVSMAPGSSLSADVDLIATGENVSGTITFRHRNVALHVDQLHSMAGGRESAARVNELLSSINAFQCVSNISGTVERPVVEFTSDLGAKVASAINKSAIESQQIAAEKREQELRTVLDNQIGEFEQLLNQQLAELRRSLNEQVVAAKKLKSALSTANSKSPVFR
jgi:uncharacterized protein (TIGR03545 family)